MVRYVQMGGGKRPIRFSINALIEFEEITGLDIGDTEGLVQMVKMKNIRALAFVGLKHGHLSENPNTAIPFTVEVVGDWLDAQNKSDILSVFSGDSSGDSDGEPTEGDKKKLNGENSAP